MTDIGNKDAVTGLARLFYRRIRKHYNKSEQWTFPPSVTTATMNRFVKDTIGKEAYGIDGNTSVQEIDIPKLLRILKDDPYLDGSTTENIVDEKNKI